MNQPLAYIHPQAKIARNVVIEPFSVINKDVEIGAGTWIGSNVTIMEGAKIGENCKIFSGTVIAAIPQDLKFQGEDSLVKIGNNTTIRENVTINRGTRHSGKTSIGNNCLIMANAHIAHDCIVKDNAIIVNGSVLGGHAVIEEFAILGGMSGIHQFNRIGKHAMISGGSFVNKDVPPFVKAARMPLSYLGVNSIGLRRNGFAAEKIREIQEIYRLLFQRSLNTTQAIQKIEAEMMATDERDEIIDFVKDSGRGIMKGYVTLKDRK